MQAKKHTRTERIASASRTRDEFIGQTKRRLPDILALARASEAAFRKMNHDQFTHSLLEQRAGSMAQRNSVELSVSRSDFEARRLASLKLIENAIVRVLQGR